MRKCSLVAGDRHDRRDLAGLVGAAGRPVGASGRLVGVADLPSHRGHHRWADRLQVGASGRLVGVADLPNHRGHHRRADRLQVVREAREARVGEHRRCRHPLRPARRA